MTLPIIFEKVVHASYNTEYEKLLQFCTSLRGLGFLHHDKVRRTLIATKLNTFFA